MPGSINIRIDKFLWAVRFFKTRSLASEACRKGKVIINNIQVKPSRVITPGEIIIIKKLPVIHTIKVIEPVENRVAAKVVHLYINDLTPDEEKEKLTNRDLGGFGYRDKGAGRPTKKERRTIDRVKEDLDSF